MAMKTDKILVIGAGGQLGAELTMGLWDEFGRKNVIATDVKSPRGKLAEGNFEILDVLDRSKLESFINENQFSHIYHLAAVLSATGEKDPGFAWKLNMDSLLYVLDAAVKFKVKQVYWPSSIAVFGDSTPRIKTPQDTVMDPSTVYGISKLAGERWCAWYHRNFGLDVRSLRYPGLIGYKAQAGGGTTDYAVEIFHKALLDKKYMSFLKPDTYLPMMYMDDAVNATLQLMKAAPESIKIRSSYNISAMSFSPREIGEEIRKHIPEFEMSYAPDFRQAIAESWPQSIDDTKARKDWGWKPEFDLSRMTREILEKLPAHQMVTHS
jgi:nucleoside-diphosphate-sugar epimerase